MKVPYSVVLLAACLKRTNLPGLFWWEYTLTWHFSACRFQATRNTQHKFRLVRASVIPQAELQHKADRPLQSKRCPESLQRWSCEEWSYHYWVVAEVHHASRSWTPGGTALHAWIRLKPYARLLGSFYALRFCSCFSCWVWRPPGTRQDSRIVQPQTWSVGASVLTPKT